MIPTQITTSPTIAYFMELEGSEGLDFQSVEIPLTKRSWNVTDEKERERIATECLGEIDDFYEQCAAWWIRPEENTAALVVYRPKTSRAIKAWEQAKAAKQFQAQQQAEDAEFARKRKL